MLNLNGIFDQLEGTTIAIILSFIFTKIIDWKWKVYITLHYKIDRTQLKKNHSYIITKYQMHFRKWD